MWTLHPRFPKVMRANWSEPVENVCPPRVLTSNYEIAETEGSTKGL